MSPEYTANALIYFRTAHLAAMDYTSRQLIASAVVGLLTLAAAWLWKLHRALSTVPPEVLEVSPHRWTDEEMDATYERMKRQRIDWAAHLPSKLDRRYVVTGGSGGVGGQLVLHLLQRGQAPESIRIVDFRRPDRADMATGPAAAVDFAQADITSPEQVEAAFARPWDPAVRDLPLTVFHTAALIDSSRRWKGAYERVRRVNVDGTQHLLDGAKAAGADVFVATTSASISYRPIHFWGNPFAARAWWPHCFRQTVDEADFDAPLRPHAEFFGNYAYAKAVAERRVCAANAPGFRTGTIRPANGVYGNNTNDVIVGLVMRHQGLPTWLQRFVQNFVHQGHVSLGHLALERALAGTEAMPKCAGRPFVITDAGPPPAYGDVYRLIARKCATPITMSYLPMLPFLLFSYAVELLDIAGQLPGLNKVVPPLPPNVTQLQPAVFSAGTYNIATDEAARKSVEEGGIGFTHAHTSFEGICQQIVEWNEEHAAAGSKGAQAANGSVDQLVQDAKKVGDVPAAISKSV